MKIGQASAGSGISERMIRHYEKIGLVPAACRGDSGYRDYSDADIQRLDLLNRATQGGHGISHVASLSNQRLEELVRDIEVAKDRVPTRATSSAEPHAAVSQALELTEALDPAGLEVLLKRNVARYGIIAFIDSVIKSSLVLRAASGVILRSIPSGPSKTTSPSLALTLVASA